MFEWNYVVITANVFLDSAAVPPNFFDVFISSGDMKLDVQINKVAAYWLKLVVCKYDSNSKVPSDVCADQGFEMLEYVVVFCDIQLASWSNFNVPGYSHHTRDACHLHDVH